jgi:CHAT domain-containing protein
MTYPDLRASILHFCQWQIDDKPTEVLLDQFYRNPANTNKRPALRQAQTTMIASDHNYRLLWSATQLTYSIN